MNQKIPTTKKLSIPFSFYKSEHTSFPSDKKINPSKPNILIICTPYKFDGLLMHSLAIYKAHLRHSYNVHILVPKNSDIEKKLIEQKISFYSFEQSKIFRPHIQPGLSKIIRKIVKDNSIDIILCNRHKEINLFKKTIDLPVKIILTRHSPSPLKTKYLEKFKTLFCVDQNCISSIENKCFKEKITPPKMYHLPPFFDEEESLKFTPCANKNEFFKKEFGITLPNYPTIVMVACLRGYKNQQLMFHALKKFIHEKNKPVNLLLCGEGYRKKYLKTLARQLKIEDYIHFLGFTYKRIEVMYHSDIKALTTKDEAFGIVLMEAALLKKPLIGTSGTGMENVIKHEKTGLLFENGNVDDLVNQIEKLITNPKLQKEYGLNAYNFVKENLTSDPVMQKLEQFYKEILK
ncbi:MAG: glycosyltransferase family 4 protein [bacterium]